jgi:ribosome-binding protein aMBF1 (putative translation factor)
MEDRVVVGSEDLWSLEADEEGLEQEIMRTESDLALLQLIARNVREARKRAGLSQRDLCRLAVMSQPYLSHVETGERNIGILTLARIARLCGVDVLDLLAPATSNRK